MDQLMELKRDVNTQKNHHNVEIIQLAWVVGGVSMCRGVSTNLFWRISLCCLDSWNQTGDADTLRLTVHP